MANKQRQLSEDPGRMSWGSSSDGSGSPVWSGHDGAAVFASPPVARTRCGESHGQEDTGVCASFTGRTALTKTLKVPKPSGREMNTDPCGTGNEEED